MSFILMGARMAGVGGIGSIAVSASTTVVSVARSMNIPITYTLSRTNYTDTVTPAVTGLPSGVTGAWSDSSLTGAETTTVLTLSASGGAGLVTNDPFVVTFSGSGVADVTINSTVTVTDSVTWTAGAGANAPSWIGKTIYPTQQFATPLPVHFSPATPEGFKGFSGFPNASNVVWYPTRVEYPTVATPLGTQPVFQLRYPGQVENITTEGQTTTVWRYAGSEYTNVGIRVSGTWTGTLSFETSTDGVTWTAKSCYNNATFTSQTSTTANSVTNKGWTATTTSASTLAEYDYFRVRASAPMTGTAIVSVGMAGGQSAANANFGSLTGSPTRFYFRMGFKTSADWSDNGNTGTKLCFFSQKSSNDGPPASQQTNHYFGMTDGATNKVSPALNLQFNGTTGNRNMPLAPTPAQLFNHGEWHDFEAIAVANTAGVPDGIAQVWMDGVQIVNESNVAYFTSIMTPNFGNFWFAPTFGGGANPPLNQTVQIAQLYYESAP